MEAPVAQTAFRRDAKVTSLVTVSATFLTSILRVGTDLIA